MTTARPDGVAFVATNGLGVPSGPVASPLSAEWNPLRTWRVLLRYARMGRGIEAVLGSGSRADCPARILEIGGTRGALAALLASPSGSSLGVLPTCEVQQIQVVDGNHLPFADGAFDCAVAVDWLPLVQPSERQHAVEELARVARRGVVLSNPFDGHEVVAAERAVNHVHRAATGVDHAELGRHVEFGLPDLDVTRAWLGNRFPHVEAWPVEPAALWQLMSTLAIFDQDAGDEVLDAGVAVFPPIELADDTEPTYRTLVVASAGPTPTRPTLPEPQPGKSTGLTALVTYLALESATQRRAFQRLIRIVTEEREREREEFRATVSSLAAEIHDLEAQAEVSAHKLREHELNAGNQDAWIAELERRVELTDLHVRNLEAERDMTDVHVRNLEAEREATAANVRKLEAESEMTGVHVRNLEAEREATGECVRQLEAEREATGVHVRNLEAERHLLTQHAAELEQRIAELKRALAEATQHAEAAIAVYQPRAADPLHRYRDARIWSRIRRLLKGGA